METVYNALQSGQELEAREELTRFLRDQFGLAAEQLEFQQSAVSLNSFKGRFVADGVSYFFKTHIESSGEVAEYEGAELLKAAGYPIIEPAYVCAQRGRELLVYPYVESPSLFEVVNGGRRPDLATLRQLQEGLDQHIFQVYKRSFKQGRPTAFPAVQQLFYRRLCGPRMDDFYREKRRVFAERLCAFEELEAAQWIVNGQDLGTLEDALQMATAKLSPDAMLPFTVVGHGDAHNGNVFWMDEGLELFDPAYAGRMDPFLDITKPLFHNVFAKWMYFPDEVETSMSMEVIFEPDVVRVNYDLDLNAFERLFLESKMTNVLGPLVTWLFEQGVLPEDFQDRLRSSLLCCPLLTMNLFDESRYSPAIAALGFARVMEMANFDFNPYLK